MMHKLLISALVGAASAIGPRELLFASSEPPKPAPCPTCETCPTCEACPPPPDVPAACDTSPVSFPVEDIAAKNEVFAQLTVAEQVAIEAAMAPKGIETAAWEKCYHAKCSFIAKIELIYPPKAEVLAYLDGTGPKPARKAQFWWFRADLAPKVASLMEIVLSDLSMPVIVKTVPWAHRPFVYWEDVVDIAMGDKMAMLSPLFDDMLASIVPTPEMLALNNGSVSPYVNFHGNGLNVPGSSDTKRVMLGATMIVTGDEDSWTMGMFKAGPLTFNYEYNWEEETVLVYDLTFCPGLGNPIYGSPEDLLAAFTSGSLLMCGIDGEFYGSTKEYMDPEPPFFAPPEMLARAEPRIYYPDGPRFVVSGRTVSWMGWDFHTDIHPLTGLHIMNLRFQGERIAYALHATEFSAVYSGSSNKKDLFYSDGGYEMGNCATTLKVGLQCPEQSVFLPSLGYDSGYVWGGALEGSETPMATCIFEAPDNEALFQHAQMRYEGLPSTSLTVRTVLTVGNYDYTQTFKLKADGTFELGKDLSGYAVGGYVLPDAPSSYKLNKMFGALLSKSSIGALHTHSAGYKFDLDIGGTENNFKVKEFKFGPLSAQLAKAGIDSETIAYSNPSSYYYDEKYITSEGTWDNDGDAVWSPPGACLSKKSSEKYIVESTSTTTLGHKRGYVIELPSTAPLLLPEHDAYLHLQNFTKCDVAVTKMNTADIEPVSMDVFGNLYPKPASPGEDLSHFFDDESLEDEDLVVYVQSTKPHFVKTEDVPVPSTMGAAVVFKPFNYFMDDVSPIKHIPDFKQEVTKCVA